MAIVDLDFIAWRDEQRERFPQFFNDLSASRVHMAFREEVALAAFRAGKAIGRDRALSHAAGQDGEQCRAASGGVLNRIADELELLVQSPFHPTRNQCRDWATELRALSRGVPEGLDSSAGAQCGGFRTKHGEHFDILYQAFTYASATDAKRLDWLAHHGASLRNDCQMEGGGWFVIAPYHTGISSVDGRARFATARAAIDAAMEGDE